MAGACCICYKPAWFEGNRWENHNLAYAHHHLFKNTASYASAQAKRDHNHAHVWTSLMFNKRSDLILFEALLIMDIKVICVKGYFAHIWSMLTFYTPCPTRSHCFGILEVNFLKLVRYKTEDINSRRWLRLMYRVLNGILLIVSSRIKSM